MHVFPSSQQSAVSQLCLLSSASFWEPRCHSSESAGFSGEETVPTWPPPQHTNECPYESINNAEHTEVDGSARPWMHINRGSRDSPAAVCLYRLTVCQGARSPNRQSPFPSPSRASWIKMKDKHFLPLFSTSAGAHLINFLISLGTNDLRDSTNPNLSLFFLLSSTKKYARATEDEERMHGWQQ